MINNMSLLIATLLAFLLSNPVTAASPHHDVRLVPQLHGKNLSLDSIVTTPPSLQRIEIPGPIPVTMRQKQSCTFMQTGSASIYYEEKGRGEPIILLQADGLDRRIWDDQVDVLAQYYRVIRFDPRNHGLTRCSADTFCHLADLCCLIHHLGIDKATLVGVSKGAAMALDFALARPEKVAGLVLISPQLNGYQVADPQVLDCQRRLAESADGPGTVELLLRTWADGPYRQPCETDLLLRRRLSEIYASTLGHRGVKGCERMKNLHTMNRLTSIHVPALIIVGGLDRPCVQAMSKELENNMTDIRKVVVHDAAHWVHMEKPGEVNRIVLDYLTKIIPWRLAPQERETEMMVMGNCSAPMGLGARSLSEPVSRL